MAKTDDANATRGIPRLPQALVPAYSPLDTARGIQAYRRGDAILYTIRGEPSEVVALMGELGRRGVGEVVALVSHRALDAELPASGKPRPDVQGAGK
jgi:hypothetical protein